MIHGKMWCPTRNRDDSSSIRFAASCRYGLGVRGTGPPARLGLARPAIFDPDGPRLAAARAGERAIVEAAT